MDYRIFDLVMQNTDIDYEKFKPEDWQKVMGQFDLLKNKLKDKSHLVKDFKYSLESYVDEFWLEKCNYFLKYGIMLGMEIQKFLSKMDEC